LGAEIIDTDQLAREVVMPDSEGLKELVAHFGEAIFDSHKQLDRAKLRDIVFKNPAERLWLEQCLHPRIRKKLLERVEASTAPYCVAVIPLLVETKPNKRIDRVLVIDSPEEQQIIRAQQRDQLSREQVLTIMKTQVSRQKRLAAADDIIYNDRDLDFLRQQVVKLHEAYIKN